MRKYDSGVLNIITRIIILKKVIRKDRNNLFEVKSNMECNHKGCNKKLKYSKGLWKCPIHDN